VTQRLLVAVVTDRGGALLLATHPRYKVVFTAPSVTERPPVDPETPPDQDGVVKLLHTYAEVGQALGLSETKVRNLVRRGEINAVSIGRSRRIPAAELERYVEHLGEQVAS
jgi:excisionase family DNA binding protein